MNEKTSELILYRLGRGASSHIKHSGTSWRDKAAPHTVLYGYCRTSNVSFKKIKKSRYSQYILDEECTQSRAFAMQKTHKQLV